MWYRKSAHSSSNSAESWNWVSGNSMLPVNPALTAPLTYWNCSPPCPRRKKFSICVLPRACRLGWRNIFNGTPSEPALKSPDERLFRTVIRRGVTKAWGFSDGATGEEVSAPGQNFAGQYIIVTWGCGVACLMAAIVDAKTGRVFPPPFHHGPGRAAIFRFRGLSPMEPLAYRPDSRLLIANICERGDAERWGAHYFFMGDDGLKLIHRVLEK
jgi:hypothetical protein